AVALAVPDAGATSHATLHVGADGRVTPVSPLGDSSRGALWAAGLALLAVAVVLTLALDHMWRVARFAVLGRGARAAVRHHRAPKGATDQEIRD
ncbi:MAG: hypothetical protein M3Q48_07925, partial [Actinomycetota bacterium]|nr:hypothetical protein [Actinomycetota bacterium]